MGLKDIYYCAYSKYVVMHVSGFLAFIRSGHGLWKDSVDAKIPYIVIEKSEKFLSLVPDSSGKGQVFKNANDANEEIRFGKLILP